MGRRYAEQDFNRVIEIKEREKKRVEIFMDEIDQSQKTLVFCATQDHALAVRDLINQIKKVKDPNFCQRVTANDGALGDEHLRAFQDNEKIYPTVLTTSQKLSTWPFFSTSPYEQRERTAVILWLTNNTVLPPSPLTSFILPRHFFWNSASPTASTSVS